MKQHFAPIVIISGAVGSGKGTIVHALAHELNIAWVPTHTTRPMRRDDPTLSHRIFDTEATFLRHKERGEFIESVEIAGNHYGLLREDLEREIRSGHPALIEMDVNGGRIVDREYNNVLLLFITADEKWRRERVVHRGMDPSELAARLNDSRHEEKIAHEHYDYIIENVENNPQECIDAIKDIIRERFPEITEKE